MKHLLFSMTCIMLWMLLPSCGVYSFSGASISPDTKTVAITTFENDARLVVPNLSQKLTDALKDQILNSTSLNYVRDLSQADVIFEGTIKDYTVIPVAISGGTANNAPTTSQQTRLTITVNVKFTDTKDEKKNFEASFPRYEDFDNTKQSLQQVEQTLIDQINVLLVQDIFNKAFVNW